MTEIVVELAEIAQLARNRVDEFVVMRHLFQLDEELNDKQLDELVDQISQRVSAQIDCTECANCCRTLDVYLTPDDAELIRSYQSTLPTEVATNLIDYKTALLAGEWGKFRHCPCAFLRGKLCSIYVDRPEACRTYPAFTPDFRWLLEDITAGAGICPIIYNVLSRISLIADDISAGKIQRHIHKS
jgi:Fe-S-cluster containining protein